MKKWPISKTRIEKVDARRTGKERKGGKTLRHSIRNPGRNYVETLWGGFEGETRKIPPFESQHPGLEKRMEWLSAVKNDKPMTAGSREESVWR